METRLTRGPSGTRLILAALLFLIAQSHCFAANANQIATGKADLIVYNAKVTTQNPAKPDAEAIATVGNTIVAVGTTAAILEWKGDKTTLIDGKGRRVIPGLNDNHLHAVIAGLKYNLNIRWDGVPTLKQALAMLAEQAKRTPEGQWVKAIGGWSPNQFKERRLPTVEEINTAVPNRPAMVQFAYNTAILNKKAMAVLKVGGPKFPKFPDTQWEKDDDGNLTGVVHGKPASWAFWILEYMVAQANHKVQKNSFQHFIKELNRMGLTSASDGASGIPMPPPKPLVELMADNKIPLRISFMENNTRGIDTLIENVTQKLKIRPGHNFHPHMDFGYTFESMGEIVQIFPQKMQGITDWENFTQPAYYPPFSETTSVTENVALRLLEHRIPFRLHATYDATINAMLDGLEKANSKIPFDGIRWSIEHAETISKRNIRRIKALGGGLAIQGRMAIHGDSFSMIHGRDKARVTPPLRWILDAGVPFSLGTDGTRAATYNPWLTLYWAVTGRSVTGREVLAQEQRLTRAEALEAYTLGSAWYQHQEKHKGRLAPGFLADFALLTADYMTAPQEQIKGIHSVLTVVDGKVAYGEGDYEKMAPVLPDVIPSWAPVKYWPGYYKGQ